MNTNTDGQPNHTVKCPPTTGAMIGAEPAMMVMKESIWAASSRS